MLVKRSKSGLYWDVMYNDIPIARRNTKREAQALILQLKHLEP